jgi:hypothetical protein
MENELTERKNWFSKNWKWFLPLALISILIFTVVITSTSKNDLTNIAQAYTETALFEKAIEKANKNKRVLQTLGVIQPIDKMAILEGNTIYTNNNKTVVLSVRIKGTRANGKIDISAYKKEREWNYTKISVRVKKTKEEIKILN